uniref:Uncharacterized protein n=1 Tax=Panagrolaimus sp. PS1159 TaxID=55785 RepID=A0AC35GRS2_9BILA
MVAASDDFTTTENNSEDTSNVNKISFVQNFQEYRYDEPQGSSSKSLPSIQLPAYNMKPSNTENFYGNVSNDNHFEVMPNMAEPYFDEQTYQQELCQNSQYSNEFYPFNPQNNTDVGEQLCTSSKNYEQKSFEHLNEYQTFAPKNYADFEQNVNNQHELVWIEYLENKTFPPQKFLSQLDLQYPNRAIYY